MLNGAPAASRLWSRLLARRKLDAATFYVNERRFHGVTEERWRFAGMHRISDDLHLA